jgi:hypothetical protein
MCGGLKPALAGAISSPSVEISWPGFAHRVIGELEETTTENMFRRHGSRRRAFSYYPVTFPAHGDNYRERRSTYIPVRPFYLSCLMMTIIHPRLHASTTANITISPSTTSSPCEQRRFDRLYHRPAGLDYSAD